MLLEKLASSERAAARQAAAALAAHAADAPLDRAARQRILKLVEHHDDPATYWQLLDSLSHRPTDEGRRLAKAGLRHELASIRRKSLEYLAAFPTREQAESIAELLSDPVADVRRLAVRAYGKCRGPLREHQFHQLLRSRDPAIRIETAVALCRMKTTLGYESLVRQAFHEDSRVRRMAAEAMGELGDPRFIAPLIGLLDDTTSIRQASLEALTRVVQDKVATLQCQRLATDREQIAYWKKWFSEWESTGRIRSQNSN